MNNKIVVIGTGGLASQMFGNLKFNSEIYCFYNNVLKIDKFLNCDVINKLDEMEIQKKHIQNFIVALSNPNLRKQFTEYCIKLKLIPKTFYSQWINESSENIIILRNCLIEADVKIGYGCCINTNVSLHHDVKLSDYVTIGPNAVLLGNVEVDKLTFIGAGAIIKEKTKIGKNCIIGMGSVVLNDVPDNEVWVGNPARFLRKNEIKSTIMSFNI